MTATVEPGRRGRPFVALVLGAASAAALSGPAAAAAIAISDLGGLASTPDATRDLGIAAAFWGGMLTNDVAVNLGVSFSPLAPNVLGYTDARFDVRQVKFVENRMRAFGSTPLDSALAAHLPTLDGAGALSVITSGFLDPAQHLGLDSSSQVLDSDGSVNNRWVGLTTANGKALGYSYEPGADAELHFSSDQDFDFDPTDGVSAGKVDFLALALHEMGHALGIASGVDDYDAYAGPSGPYSGYLSGDDPNNYVFADVLDLFRYSANINQFSGGSPLLDWSVGTGSYFSLDGGLSAFNGGYFSTGIYNGDGYGASHWRDNHYSDGTDCTYSVALGIMDPTLAGCEAGVVTALDLAALDAIGWNAAVDVLAQPQLRLSTAQIYGAAVPEPAAWILNLAGFATLGVAVRWRRRTARLAVPGPTRAAALPRWSASPSRILAMFCRGPITHPESVMKFNLIAACIALFLSASTPAAAAMIEYDLSGVGSGAFVLGQASEGFSDLGFLIKAFGETTTLTDDPAHSVRLVDITVAKLTLLGPRFAGTADLAVNPTARFIVGEGAAAGIAGFGNLASGLYMPLTYFGGGGLTGYDGASGLASIGVNFMSVPPTFISYLLQVDVASDGGQFTFTSIHNGAFSATRLDSASVPEPSNWAMMLSGLGAVGALVRCRNRKRSIGRRSRFGRRAVAQLGLAAGLLFFCQSASAATLTYTASLNGVQSTPSIATGFASVTIDPSQVSMSVNLTFADLVRTATGAHIHCCAASGSAASPIVFNLTNFPGATSGSYAIAEFLSNSSFSLLADGLAAGEAYIEVGDSLFPQGEIRGILAAPSRGAAVPEASSWILMVAGFVGLGVGLRVRKGAGINRVSTKRKVTCAY